MSLVELIDQEQVESFRVMIDARTRHVDLWRLVKTYGSVTALAKAADIRADRLRKWINLRAVPDRVRSESEIHKLELLTGKMFDDLWPPALRAAIVTGRASLRREFEFDTANLVSAALARSRLILPSPEEPLMIEDRKSTISSALNELRPRDRLILELRYGLGESDGPHTLEEISSRIGISKERIRQCELRALNRLRRPDIASVLTRAK